MVREQTGFAWTRAKTLCADGRVTIDGARCLDPAFRVPAGAVVVVDRYAPKVHTSPLAPEAIVFADRDIVVIDKPAGMLSVADEADNKDTLADYARTLLRRMKRGVDGRLGVVHRLDRETSGLIVFTRNPDAKRTLAERFKAHDIERVYHAIVHGVVYDAVRVETDLTADRGDGLRGSFGHFRPATGNPPAHAKRAITMIQPLAELDGATLVECRLETGRQHQIRIHLSELGHALIGERVYIRDHRGPRIKAPRPMLHARVLGFAHPRREEVLRFEREPPDDFQGMVATLRRRQ